MGSSISEQGSSLTHAAGQLVPAGQPQQRVSCGRCWQGPRRRACRRRHLRHLLLLFLLSRRRIPVLVAACRRALGTGAAILQQPYAAARKARQGSVAGRESPGQQETAAACICRTDSTTLHVWHVLPAVLQAVLPTQLPT